MNSPTFLPSYDPALLEPLGSPCLPDTTNNTGSPDSDFLFPHNAYEDSLSSCLSASQSPSYNSPECSSIDSGIYGDMDQKPYGLPTDGVITMMPTNQDSSRHSWDSDYNQHLGYTYASPEMQHAQPDVMEPRAPMLVVSNEGFWNNSSSHSSNGGFYQVSNGTSWSHPTSMEPPVTVHPSTDKLFSNGDSYHLPSPRRISHASASKPRSLKVESKRKSTSASSPSTSGRPSPYSRPKASKHATPDHNEASGSWDCAHCSLPFRDLPSLDKHVKSEHTRPLICVFHWAGCTSRFASKNEWKRHVFSQHLALRYWLCTEGTCGHSRSSNNARRRSSSLPSVGCIFNRKDLYTQHLRRMHVQGEVKKSSKKSKDSGNEDFIREMQTRAARIRCELPTFMTCPAENCTIEFHGPNAWDDRMEHVAGHLENAAVGDEPPVSFGGFGDWTLTGWAEGAEVEVVKRTANGWRLCNPLKGDSGSGNTKRSNSSSKRSGVEEIEDAEGEEEYGSAWPYPAPATAQ